MASHHDTVVSQCSELLRKTEENPQGDQPWQQSNQLWGSKPISPSSIPFNMSHKNYALLTHASIVIRCQMVSHHDRQCSELLRRAEEYPPGK